MQQSRVFVGMVLILIFGEVLGLYGYCLLRWKHLEVRVLGLTVLSRLIVGLILNSKS